MTLMGGNTSIEKKGHRFSDIILRKEIDEEFTFEDVFNELFAEEIEELEIAKRNTKAALETYKKKEIIAEQGGVYSRDLKHKKEDF